MPIEFVDRASSQPGRVLLTPETGDPFYAKMERADEPSVVGTPLNAENLNKAQETLAYTDTTSVSTYKKLYVSPAGNDDNDGLTDATPMLTIKAAIRKYAKWHKMLDITLASGTYTEDFGRMALDQCSLAIRSENELAQSVKINLSQVWETNVQLLRLYDLTLNVTTTDSRAIAVASGMLYASGVKIVLPTASTAHGVSVHYGSSAWLINCILDTGTSAGAAVYADQAQNIRVINCTSTRTVNIGVYANAGSVIEYTPTLTATTEKRETNNGKCLLITDRPGSVAGEIGDLYGQYKTSDGLLFQWGTVSITPTAANTVTTTQITFPIAYTERPFITGALQSNAPQVVSWGVGGGTTVEEAYKGMIIYMTRTNTAATTFRWMAIGR